VRSCPLEAVVEHLRNCLNPKVIAGVAAAAAAVWVFAPGAFAAALPLLILAVCPLSMIAMALVMRHGSGSASPAHTAHDEPDGVRLSERTDTDRRAVEALRAKVAELEDRLASERPDERGGAPLDPSPSRGRDLRRQHLIGAAPPDTRER
jgi:UPF0716 family protein affecting phage T7 exclusion